MADNFCKNCGSAINSNQGFCPSCGQAVAPTSKPKKESKRRSGDIIYLVGIVAVTVIAFFIFSQKADRPSANEADFKHPDTPGMPAGASADYSQTLALLPKSYDSLVQLGNHFMDNQIYPLAIECYQRALSQNETDANVITDLGACYHYAGEKEKALAQFEKAIALNPQHAIAHFNMGIVYREMNNREKAAQHWRKYIELDPQSPMADTIKKYLSESGGQ